MATADELNALADRCEREEVSRPLDAAIWEISGQINEGHCAAWCKQDGRSDLTRKRYVAAWAPKFCTSLDAAVSLVPEPGAWELESQGWACVTLLTGRFLVSDDIECRAIAKTPALALCAAALRARAVSCKSTGAMRSEPKASEPVHTSPNPKESA